MSCLVRKVCLCILEVRSQKRSKYTILTMTVCVCYISVRGVIGGGAFGGGGLTSGIVSGVACPSPRPESPELKILKLKKV